MPTSSSYANPVGRDPADPAPPKPRQQTSELTVCISLASLMDFDKTGYLTQENWQKGMTTLMLEELGMDPKIWSRLVDMHGGRDAGKGLVNVQKLCDVVPIDPRVAVLLSAIVKGLVGMRDFVSRTLHKEERDTDSKKTRIILNMRRKITEPVMRAWRDYVRSDGPDGYICSHVQKRTHRNTRAQRRWCMM